MDRKSVKEIIKQSGIKFGTSGARGLVSQFTDEVSAAFAVSFVNSMKEQGINVEKVAVGIDRRPSSPSIAASIAGVLTSLGFEVEYFGVLPTPALALYALVNGVPAIMVTGSHIPFDRNGIKFYRPDGEITKQDEQSILVQSTFLPEFLPQLPEAKPQASEEYIKRYTHGFSNSFLSNLRIGVYEHSAAGRDLSKEILRKLGAEVFSLGKTDTFVPIDTEAVSEQDQQQAFAWSEAHSLDAIFSTDGDGDRPLIADEHGHWLKGDVVGMLCAKFISVDALSVPISCNSSIESFLNVPVNRTKIGSPYVIESMQQQVEYHQVVAGFEANGGFLCGTPFSIDGAGYSALPTRDALLPVLAILAMAKKEGCTISNLLSTLPQRYTDSDRVTEFPTDLSKLIIKKYSEDQDRFVNDFDLKNVVKNIDQTDGLRVTLKSEDIVHLRPSGNAPELRCYCESKSNTAASLLLRHMMKKLSELKP